MTQQRGRAGISPAWRQPPAEFSQAPLWFWNDDLTEDGLLRQLDDFLAHGVQAFVPQPRVGLPRSIGWLSDRMIALLRCAIEGAAARGMWVFLYDEGMYPSGSSSGQVVAEDPAFRCRGLVHVDLDEASPGDTVDGIRLDADGEPALGPDQHLVAVVPREANGHRIAVIDRPVGAVIRGLHYLDHDVAAGTPAKMWGAPAHDCPPAADLLNPDAVRCFVRLVYERFYREFGAHFGTTVKAVFTDEPKLTAKLNDPGVRPGTTGILDHMPADSQGVWDTEIELTSVLLDAECRGVHVNPTQVKLFATGTVFQPI